jgi:hypothetical protein
METCKFNIDFRAYVGDALTELVTQQSQKEGGAAIAIKRR